MDRGDIYIVSLDPIKGHEQAGTRPVLIVSPKAFNAVTNAPVVLPITSKGSFARTRGFAVSLDDAGLKTKGVIRCDQPRTLDIKSRKGKLAERVPMDIMDDVLAKLNTILS